ncbi:MAG: hypothetical protein SPI36_03365 [Candidatus Onthovivens sp.]|nr:hypothetical protein [Candidatus Onthovivens sp.]MDY6058269.1 hypothetical protein [Candidatus Onthovivens sp.]
MKVKQFVEQHKGETCVIKVYSNATIFTKHIEMKDNKAYWVNLKEKHIAHNITKEFEKEVLSIEEEETKAIDPITTKTSKIKVYNLQVKRLTNRNKRFTISLGKELVEAKGKFVL